MEGSSVLPFWKNLGLTLLSGLLAAGIIVLAAIAFNGPDWKKAAASSVPVVELDAFPIAIPHIQYGFALDTFQVEEAVFQEGQILGQILAGQGMSAQDIMTLATHADSVFSVRKIQANKPYVFLTRHPGQGADFLIYEPNPYEYVVYHLKEDLRVERKKRPIETVVESSGGIIEASLWNAMIDNGMSFELAAKMEDALQWSVDFHHLQKQDRFKLIYEQNYIDGEEVGPGQVLAAYFQNAKGEHYAFFYQNGEHAGYYDCDGRPMKSDFLKAPVKYSRISSRYNLSRYHPILKRVRPHLGTDYAAPYGTPIVAVGDGVVTQATYAGGNGNFVRIKHDETYETQYLHMQKFAAGIRPGVRVRQGDVIGYVGSTGLATGPHVCFRFWKNGQQINHLNLKFSNPEPLPNGLLPDFFAKRDAYLAQLDELVLLQATADESPQGNP